MESLETISDKSAVSRWLGLGCVLLVVAASLHSADRKIGGGDTWVAMECGRYTLGPWAQQQPDRTWRMHLLDKFGIHITKRDPFSAESRPFNPEIHEDSGWVNQNWLTHVVFYKMRAVWGENSIVVYKFVQAVLTALLAYWTARVLGAHPMLAGAAVAFGILLSRSFIDLRPNQSSIFCAAIMMLILARWKQRGIGWAMAWMIPVMIIWSNVHGGFIYAMMVFTLAAGAHLVGKYFQSVWPESFVAVDWRKYKILLLGLALVWLIPGIFSPFGWENVLHPLIVATGEEGKIWRDVIEWKPIWDTSGFGNATPYVFFLAFFGLVSVTWWFLFFSFKPSLPQSRRRRQRRAKASYPWPTIDLAQWAVIGVTIYMSIKSRRFIFLGGVVLAPFLAQLGQEVVNMVRLRRRFQRQQPLQLPPMDRRLVLRCVGLNWAAAAVMGTIAIWAMWDIYYRPAADGSQLSVFRRMVGIHDQPVRAINFFDDNQIKGVVFNEWTNGGFVAFWQKPDPKTGEPACKVFMDGRSQAAYRVSHFAFWRTLRTVPEKEDPQIYKKVEQLAQQMNLAPTDPKFFDTLLNKINIIGSEDYPSTKAYRQTKKNYQAMIYFALSNPKLLDNILKREGINVALLSLVKSKALFKLFSRLDNWPLLYIDDRNAIFLQKDAPANRALFRKEPAQLKYPDDFARRYSLGYNYCRTLKPQKVIDGVKLLMQVERYVPKIHDLIYKMGVQVGMTKEIQKYFLRQREIYKARVDSNQELGRLYNVVALLSSCDRLAQLSRQLKRPQEAQQYMQELKIYQVKQVKVADEVKEGWLW